MKSVVRAFLGTVRMFQIFLVAVLASGQTPGDPLSASGPLVQVTDGAVSVHAQGARLDRLLAALDGAVGTESTVPAELRGYDVSVWFEGVDAAHAVRRIFEEVPLDYVMIGDKRLIVTGVSQAPQSRSVAPAVARATPPTRTQPQPAAANPFQIPGQVPGAGTAAQNRGQPAGVFGVTGNPQVNSQSSGPQQPFGAPNGTLSQPPAFPTGTSIFGNTSPTMLDLNQSQQSPSSPVQSSPFPPGMVPVPGAGQPTEGQSSPFPGFPQQSPQPQP